MYIISFIFGEVSMQYAEIPLRLCCTIVGDDAICIVSLRCSVRVERLRLGCARQAARRLPRRRLRYRAGTLGCGGTALLPEGTVPEYGAPGAADSEWAELHVCVGVCLCVCVCVYVCVCVVCVWCF